MRSFDDRPAIRPPSASLSLRAGQKRFDPRPHRLTHLVAVDTVITGIYGMNFDNMPELHHHYAYFVCLAVMLALNVALDRLFRRSGWL